MTDPSSSPTPVGTLLRVSVTAGDRRVDLGVPGNVAAAEIVPGLARTLGVLDAASVYGGYRLVRADGEPVDSARSLLAAGVEDGAVLTLESGARKPEVRVYDDVVEAVADAVESQYQPWTSRDSALGAAWGAVALVLVAAALLVGADPAAAMPPVVAAAGAVLALACGAVVGRVGREPATGRILVLAAAVLGGVAGLTVGTSAPGWGWPAVWAGVGLVVAGLVGMPALVDRRELAAGPVVLGLALAVSGATVALTDAAAGEVLAVVVAIVVTASIGVPWLALSSTPLRVVSARTEAEILLDPPPVDPERVRRQLESGHRLQVSLRVAVGPVRARGHPGGRRRSASSARSCCSSASPACCCRAGSRTRGSTSCWWSRRASSGWPRPCSRPPCCTRPGGARWSRSRAPARPWSSGSAWWPRASGSASRARATSSR